MPLGDTMRGLIWNIQGFGKLDRRRQLIEYIRDQRIDFMGLQQTIRSSFSQVELDSLGGAVGFQWEWVPTSGRSGGILLGVNRETFEVLPYSRGNFFIGVEMIQRDINFKWELVVVYGPADPSRSQDFFRELHDKVHKSANPLVIAGDFNLISRASEKSNSNINLRMIRAFRAAIDDLHLM